MKAVLICGLAPARAVDRLAARDALRDLPRRGARDRAGIRVRAELPSAPQGKALQKKVHEQAHLFSRNGEEPETVKTVNDLDARVSDILERLHVARDAADGIVASVSSFNESREKLGQVL